MSPSSPSPVLRPGLRPGQAASTGAPVARPPAAPAPRPVPPSAPAPAAQPEGDVVRRIGAGARPPSPLPTRPQAPVSPSAPNAGDQAGKTHLAILIADTVSDDPEVRQKARVALRVRVTEHFGGIFADEEFAARLRHTVGIAYGTTDDGRQKQLAAEFIKAAMLDLCDLTRPNIEDYLKASEASVRASVLEYASMGLIPSRAAHMGTFVVQKSNGAAMVRIQPEIPGLTSVVRNTYRSLGEPRMKLQFGVVRQADLDTYVFDKSAPPADAITHVSKSLGVNAAENPIVGVWARILSATHPELDLAIELDLEEIRLRLPQGSKPKDEGGQGAAAPKQFGKNNYYASNPKMEFVNPVLREILRLAIDAHGHGLSEDVVAEHDGGAEAPEIDPAAAAAAGPQALVEPSAASVADALQPRPPAYAPPARPTAKPAAASM